MVDRAAIDYVRAYLGRGYDSKNIKAYMIAAGYPLAQIEGAFNAIQQERIAVIRRERIQTLMLFIALVVLTVAVISLAMLIHQIWPPPSLAHNYFLFP